MAPGLSTINRICALSLPHRSPSTSLSRLRLRSISPISTPVSVFSLTPQRSSLVGLQPLHTFSRSQTVPVRSRTLHNLNRLLVWKSTSLLRVYSTVVVHSKGGARFRRTISFLIISTLSFLIGGYYALSYAPPILTPLIMGSMPTDVETLAMYQPNDDFAREVDEHIRNCPLAQSLRANPDFKESRPHLKIPPEIRQHNLTAGTLSGPGMLVVPPYYFNEKDGKSMVQIFYVGGDVCGHPGLVHGGFIATILDEGLARCAFPAMPNKVGVTANLEINYRKPTAAGQFLVLRAKTTKVEGRKAWAEGWIESLEVPEGEEPAKLVEAKALFIEPKHAKVLQSLYKVNDNE
ncbi:hypothetical protein ABEF92_005513 [Exophiala dermatitidis]|uniref:Thioesterase domain-containing protein n=2 Tax=Exophiala dermatitidis TaxID=5970 RepID=H6BX76_EXODN|nr:uncharacterized protein HMPREF1120_04271 [Exophiala dermatitidis NIH/UT8656]EHY56178.1 hypothetical protein HMPREF1120_04271 [Exophiala dermatitidis NIH/UT8656]